MNNIVRMPSPAGAPPAFGQRSGPMIWNGSSWVPSPCDDCGPPGPPCPPPGWPPPGCPPWWSGANSPPWYPGANAGVSFGTSPPPNPTRGHFWWDGRTQWLFDGAAWVAIGGSGAAGAGATFGPTPPASPGPGALWYDGSDLLIYTGSTWVHASGSATGTTPPANPQDGMTWWNGSQLMIWDGNAWIPVSQTKTYVQATQPPTPNPGDQWWDGTTMRIYTGTAWAIVGPGSFQGPVGTTTQTLMLTQQGTSPFPLSSAWQPLLITTTPQTDTQNGWNTTTHQYRPTVAGIYLFEVTMTAWAQAGYNMGFSLARNDLGTIDNSTDVVCSWVGGGGGSEVFIAQGSGTKRMNGTTDYVRLFGFANGSPTNSYLSPAVTPVLKATLLP